MEQLVLSLKGGRAHERMWHCRLEDVLNVGTLPAIDWPLYRPGEWEKWVDLFLGPLKSDGLWNLLVKWGQSKEPALKDGFERVVINQLLDPMYSHPDHPSLFVSVKNETYAKSVLRFLPLLNPFVTQEVKAQKLSEFGPHGLMAIQRLADSVKSLFDTSHHVIWDEHHVKNCQWILESYYFLFSDQEFAKIVDLHQPREVQSVLRGVEAQSSSMLSHWAYVLFEGNTIDHQKSWVDLSVKILQAMKDDPGFTINESCLNFISHLTHRMDVYCQGVYPYEDDPNDYLNMFYDFLINQFLNEGDRKAVGLSAFDWEKEAEYPSLHPCMDALKAHWLHQHLESTLIQESLNHKMTKKVRL